MIILENHILLKFLVKVDALFNTLGTNSTSVIMMFLKQYEKELKNKINKNI